MSQIYETLLDMDPETRELVPKLAESYELIDPKTWQFKLREGIKFSNGEPFNAAAVKYSIERVLDPKTASPSASPDRLDRDRRDRGRCNGQHPHQDARPGTTETDAADRRVRANLYRSAEDVQ